MAERPSARAVRTDAARTDGLHWSALDAFPEESGFWSVVRSEDIAAVGRDHATFSSEDGSILVVDKLSWDMGTPTRWTSPARC